MVVSATVQFVAQKPPTITAPPAELYSPLTPNPYTRLPKGAGDHKCALQALSALALRTLGKSFFESCRITPGGKKHRNTRKPARVHTTAAPRLPRDTTPRTKTSCQKFPGYVACYSCRLSTPPPPPPRLRGPHRGHRARACGPTGARTPGENAPHARFTTKQQRSKQGEREKLRMRRCHSFTNPSSKPTTKGGQGGTVRNRRDRSHPRQGGKSASSAARRARGNSSSYAWVLRTRVRGLCFACDNAECQIVVGGLKTECHNLAALPYAPLNRETEARPDGTAQAHQIYIHTRNSLKTLLRSSSKGKCYIHSLGTKNDEVLRSDPQTSLVRPTFRHVCLCVRVRSTRCRQWQAREMAPTPSKLSCP